MFALVAGVISCSRNRNSKAEQYREARNGAQLVPMGIPRIWTSTEYMILSHLYIHVFEQRLDPLHEVIDSNVLGRGSALLKARGANPATVVN